MGNVITFQPPPSDAPLPSDLDFRRNKSFSLSFEALDDIGIATAGDKVAFCAAVTLFAAAWRYLPAGRLPDDEAKLAWMAGLGRDVKAWRRAREAGALDGWAKASDGFLYHPDVTKHALVSMVRQKAGRSKKRPVFSAKPLKFPKLASSSDGGQEQRPAEPISPPVFSDQPIEKPQNQEKLEPSAEPARGGDYRRVDLFLPSVLDPVPLVKKKAGSSTSKKPRAKPALPCLNDPPSAWSSIADSWEIDPKSPIGERKPCVAGWHIDTICELIGTEAKLNWRKRYDWNLVAGWLRDGMDPHEEILPLIRRIAARPGYKPPERMKYFDACLRNG